MLTADDLVPDQTLKRRIERRLATQARNEEGMDEDDDDKDGDGSAAKRAQTVDSQFEPNLDHLSHIKPEARSGVERRSEEPATQHTENEEEVGGGGGGGGRRRRRRGTAPSAPTSAPEVIDLNMDDSDEGG